MIRSSVSKADSLSLIAVIPGCAAPQSLEISRAQTTDQLFQPTALTAASRKFRAAVPSVINFDIDSSELDAEALSKLDGPANWIIDNPRIEFRVDGYADQVGTQDDNIKLGQRRADAVAQDGHPASVTRSIVDVGPLPRNRIASYPPGS